MTTAAGRILSVIESAPAPEGGDERCSCDVPHPAHTYGGRPMILCKGMPKPDCDGSVVRATGQCNQCLAYHVAHPTSESGTAELSRQQSTFSDDVIPDAGDHEAIAIYKVFRKWRATQKRPLVNDAFIAGYKAAKAESGRVEEQEEAVLRRISEYRSGYSCGYSDAKNGTRMRDKDAAEAFFRSEIEDGTIPDVFVDEQPLGNCETPHFLGEPTPDRKALTQQPHYELPQGLCKNFMASHSQPSVKEKL